MKSTRKTEEKQTDQKTKGPDETTLGTSSADAAASTAATSGAAGDMTPLVPSPADDRLLRLQADFDNYRKRVLREKEDLYSRANEDIMGELLPVLDHLELAVAAAGNAAENDLIIQGFKLVAEQLVAALTKFGLTPIVAEKKVEFDPNVHEAILHIPSDDVPENKIISKTRAGFMLGSRLLRAAQVVVSSGAPAGAEESTAT